MQRCANRGGPFSFIFMNMSANSLPISLVIKSSKSFSNELPLKFVS